MAFYNEMMNQIYNEGIYYEGFNYLHMYNIIVHNILGNIIPTETFIYTYTQMNRLYDFLTPLIMNNLYNNNNNDNNNNDNNLYNNNNNDNNNNDNNNNDNNNNDNNNNDNNNNDNNNNDNNNINDDDDIPDLIDVGMIDDIVPIDVDDNNDINIMNYIINNMNVQYYNTININTN